MINNPDSIARKIRKEQEEIDEEKKELENLLTNKKLKKLLLLFHPRIRKKMKELTLKEKKLQESIKENMELIHLEALLESKQRYGWELLLTEKELDFLKNFENDLQYQKTASWYKKINNYLKNKYSLSLESDQIIPNSIVRLALKYNVGISNRKKVEEMFYQLTYFVPYYEWGLSFGRHELITLLIKKIEETKNKLEEKIQEIDSIIN
ncbi:MAG: hypothetical protein KatS3mg095_0612 [Candidatus Parcubacteria bacterium]|nr:MAG: hypothetical protein KatS3mg095_0612 [Candidatus Parcubacteria bacterium]